MATFEFTPEAIPFPQLLGRHVGNTGVELIVLKEAGATPVEAVEAPKEAVAANEAGLGAGNAAGKEAGAAAGKDAGARAGKDAGATAGAVATGAGVGSCPGCR